MIGLILGGLARLSARSWHTFSQLLSHLWQKARCPDQQQHFSTLSHYQDGKFINQIPSDMDMSLSSLASMMRDYVKGDPNRQPKTPPPVEKIDSLDIATPREHFTRVTWFGHSALLLETGGKNILLDPMLGESPAPHPLLGSKRYSETLPISHRKTSAY